MDLSGARIYGLMIRGSIPEKVAVLSELKTHVKKDNIDLVSVPKYFEAVSVAMDTEDAALRSVAFSLACHLVKRVSIQDSKGKLLRQHGFLVLPIIVSRIADPKLSVKLSAKRALEAHWLSAPQQTEQAVIDIALANRSPLLVNEAVAWLNHILTTINPHFNLDPFLEPLARNLSKHETDQTLTSNIRVLLENYYELKHNRLHKFDLQKILEANNVSPALRTSIMGTDSVLAHTSANEQNPFVESKHSAERLPARRSSPAAPVKHVPSTANDHVAGSRAFSHETIPESSHRTLSSTPPNSALTALLNSVAGYSFDSTFRRKNVSSSSEVHQLASSMQPRFEGKETERNWTFREKHIIELRSLIRGNSANEYFSDLMHIIHELQEGICKSLSSLRTTLSVNSCQLVKEMAYLFHSKFDVLADLFIPTLIKLCSNTKHLSNSNAHAALCSIFSHCSFANKYGQRIYLASLEKSTNTRSYAPIWLQIYILRSHDSWGSSGSELVDKVLSKLLSDSSMQVRAAARNAYWVYNQYVPSAAAKLLQNLDPNAAKALERSRPQTAENSKLPASFSLSKSRPSLKETIIAKNRELKSRQSISRSSSRNNNSRPTLPSTANGHPSEFPISKNDNSLANDDVITSVASLSRKASGFSTTLGISDHETGSMNGTKSRAVTPSKTVPPSMEAPNHLVEPHYAQSTFSQSSSSTDCSARHSRKQSIPRRQSRDLFDSSGTHTPNRSGSQSETTETAKNKLAKSDCALQFTTNDSIMSLLSSKKQDKVTEGVDLLRASLLRDESLPHGIISILRDISISNPFILEPLFEENEKLFKKTCKLFSSEDFMRLICLMIPPSSTFIDPIVSVFSTDSLYGSMETILSYACDLDNIVDEKLLVMQIIKYKTVILQCLMQLMRHAITKIPITDVNFTKLTGSLFDLIPLIYQTQLIDDYSHVLRKLYAINSTLFVSQLVLVQKSHKQEIENLVGIDNVLHYQNTNAVFFNVPELTQIAPGKDIEQLSPLKFPSDFTLLLPSNKTNPDPRSSSNEVKTEPKLPVSLEEVNSMPVESISSQVIPKLEERSDEDVLMDEATDKFSECGDRLGGENNTFHGNIQDANILDTKKCADIDPQDDECGTNTFVKANKKKLDPHFLTRLSPELQNELVDDFASVCLTNQANSIEMFIDKIDPLQKMSSRSRPITIFEDSQGGSPQKVKEYNYTDLNWFNFLMARMLLNQDLREFEDCTIESFRSLCETLITRSSGETNIAGLLKCLQSPRSEEFNLFLAREGYILLENSLLVFLSHDECDILGGLMVLKQLLINRHVVDPQRLWETLVDISQRENDDPLQTMDIAVGETFDEALCGIYSSLGLFHIVTGFLMQSDERDERELKFVLRSILKLVSSKSLVLTIDTSFVSRADKAVRKFINHERAEIRKLTIEIYGRILHAASSYDPTGVAAERSSEEKSSLRALNDIMAELSYPEQKLIEHYSR